MIPICEKSEVTSIKKGKIFNISPNITHFSKFFSYRASYLLVYIV